MTSSIRQAHSQGNNPWLELAPLQRLPTYPHMLPLDTLIWNRFIDAGIIPNARVFYDLHIGTPAPTPPGLEENYARMIGALSQKRIDVVIFRSSVTLVAEIKPYAGTSAIGQALSYAKLFKDKFPRYPTIRPCIITDHAQPDISELCVAYNIVLLQLD